LLGQKRPINTEKRLRQYVYKYFNTTWHSRDTWHPGQIFSYTKETYSLGQKRPINTKERLNLYKYFNTTWHSRDTWHPGQIFSYYKRDLLVGTKETYKHQKKTLFIQILQHHMTFTRHLASGTDFLVQNRPACLWHKRDPHIDTKETHILTQKRPIHTKKNKPKKYVQVRPGIQYEQTRSKPKRDLYVETKGPMKGIRT